jgi:hypothetical protein
VEIRATWWQMRAATQFGVIPERIAEMDALAYECRVIQTSPSRSLLRPCFCGLFFVFTFLLACNSYNLGIVAAQGLPKSYISEQDKTRFELSRTNEFRRQTISIAFHELELRELEYLQNQQFVDLLGLSDSISLELSSLLKDYDSAIKLLRQELRSGRSADKVTEQVKTTADEIREWYKKNLTTEQKSIATSVAIRQQVLYAGIWNVLQRGMKFTWFDESLVVEPTTHIKLKDYSELIKQSWGSDSRAALAKTVEALLDGTDPELIKYVKKSLLPEDFDAPISICIVRMKGTTPLNEHVELDLRWVRTGNDFSYKIDAIGRLGRSNLRVHDDAWPLAILLDRETRGSLKVDLLPEQLEKIQPHFHDYFSASQSLRETTSGLVHSASRRSEIDELEKTLLKSLRPIGDRYSDLVEAELLPAQWQQLESISWTRHIYEHGLYAIVEKLVEQFETEHATEIDRERLKRNSEKAQRRLDEEISSLESRYRAALRSAVGDSNRKLFSVLEAASALTKESCLCLFVFGATQLESSR